MAHLKLLEDAIKQEWSEGRNWTDEAKWQLQNYQDLRELTFKDITDNLIELGRLTEDEAATLYPDLYGEDDED